MKSIMLSANIGKENNQVIKRYKDTEHHFIGISKKYTVKFNGKYYLSINHI